MPATISNWTIAAAIAAIVSALVAAYTLTILRRNSNNSARPYLGAELVKPPYSRGVQDLVIKNFGATEARHVSVTFDPPIPDPLPEDEPQSVTSFLKRRYAKPISALLPGQELSNVWFSGVPSGDGWKNTEPTPDDVKVTLTYHGANPKVKRRTKELKVAPYTSVFDLSVSLIRTYTVSQASGSPQSMAKEALKTLRNLDKTMVGIAKSLLPPATTQPGPAGEFQDPAKLFQDPRTEGKPGS